MDEIDESVDILSTGLNKRTWYNIDHKLEKPGKAIMRFLIGLDILLVLLVISLIISSLVFQLLSKKEYKKYNDPSVDFKKLTAP